MSFTSLVPAGVPSVCTELGTGTSYVNQDGVTGLVVPPRDPDALAFAQSLLKDPEVKAEAQAAVDLIKKRLAEKR